MSVHVIIDEFEVKSAAILPGDDVDIATVVMEMRWPNPEGRHRRVC